MVGLMAHIAPTRLPTLAEAEPIIDVPALEKPVNHTVSERHVWLASGVKYTRHDSR
jgi:hypothetical protein